jgi:hypothetical protein
LPKYDSQKRHSLPKLDYVHLCLREENIRFKAYYLI